MTTGVLKGSTSEIFQSISFFFFFCIFFQMGAYACYFLKHFAFLDRQLQVRNVLSGHFIIMVLQGKESSPGISRSSLAHKQSIHLCLASGPRLHHLLTVNLQILQ